MKIVVSAAPEDPVTAWCRHLTNLPKNTYAALENYVVLEYSADTVFLLILA